MQESWIRWSFALLLLIGTASMPVVAADGESKPEAETAADSDAGEGHEEDHDEGHDDHEGHDHDEHGHEDGHHGDGHGHHDHTDLSHANASHSLNDSGEFKKDMAIYKAQFTDVA